VSDDQHLDAAVASVGILGFGNANRLPAERASRGQSG
jgi:hypothetical protein